VTSKLRSGLRLGPQILFGVIVIGGVGITCLFLFLTALV
jgi:hypothetical protein